MEEQKTLSLKDSWQSRQYTAKAMAFEELLKALLTAVHCYYVKKINKEPITDEEKAMFKEIYDKISLEYKPLLGE